MPSDTLAGVTVTAVACNVAVPLNVTTCGLLFALSVMVKVPVRAPVTVGAKATLTVQLPFPANVAPHVVPATVKSPAGTMPEIVIAAARLFFTVTVCDALVVDTACNPNVTALGNAVACGVTPVPVKLDVIGLVPWSTLTTRLPGRLPATVGVNVTLYVHELEPASELPQVFVCA